MVDRKGNDMHKEDLEYIRKHHDKLELLEHEGRFEDADVYYKLHRTCFNWDYNGNWTGEARNENGWTP